MGSARKRKPYEKPFRLGHRVDQCVLSLEGEGIDCVPLFGYNHHLIARKTADFHAHRECVEVIFCLRGDGLYLCEGKEYRFRAGSVFVSNPGQMHRLKIYHKGLRMYWIQFRLPAPGFPMLGLAADESDWLAERLQGIPRRLFAGTNMLKAAFSRLFQVYGDEKPGSVRRRVLLKGAVLDLLTALVESPFTEPRVMTNRKVSEIVREMRSEPAMDYPLEVLSKRVRMSTGNLLAAFKRQTGLSPHAYLISCRIETAKKELLSGLSVAVVSGHVGFSSPQRFATCFRQATGLSPRDWLKLQKT